MLDTGEMTFLRENFCDKFNFSQSDLSLIFNNAYKKNLRKNQIIYAGDDCLGMVFVKDGLLRAFISTRGKEMTVFGIKSGECCMICDTCKFAESQNRVSVEASEACELIIIPPNIFRILKEKYKDVLNFTLEIVAKRFSQVINASEQAIFLPLNERIMGFLRENMDEGNEIKITHEELANHIGSAREAVSRVLKEAEKAGKIELGRGFIKIIS